MAETPIKNFKSESPQEVHDRLQEMAAAEARGFAKASEGQATVMRVSAAYGCPIGAAEVAENQKARLAKPAQDVVEGVAATDAAVGVVHTGAQAEHVAGPAKPKRSHKKKS